MNRLHPEDLKQLLAAMLAPMVTSQPETDLANGLEWADMLMGMAAKTAKPERCCHEWEPCEDRSTGMKRTGLGCRKCDTFMEGPTPTTAKPESDPHADCYTFEQVEKILSETKARAEAAEAKMIHWRQKAWGNAARAEKAEALAETRDETADTLSRECVAWRDRATKAEARVKELEAEVSRQRAARERSIRLMGSKIERQKTQLRYFHDCGIVLLQARAEKAESERDTLKTQLAAAKAEERERLKLWLRHTEDCCAMLRGGEINPIVEDHCICGLRAALEAKP